jgi:hypothetical protein
LQLICHTSAARGEGRALAVLDLDDVEVTAGTAHEVDLAAARHLSHVQALRQDKCLDQPLGELIAAQQGAPNHVLHKRLLVEGESWHTIERDCVQ